MDFPNYVLFITGFLDLLLGLVVFLRNRKNQVTVAFALFSICLAGWAIGIGFFRNTASEAEALFWAKTYYISASLIAASLFYFALVFPSGKNLSLRQKALIIIPALIHSVLLTIPHYLTHKIVFHPWGKEVILGNIEYSIYSLYFLPFFYGALFILWSKYKKSIGLVKQQLLLVTVSILIASIFGVAFNLILPWVGNYKLVYMGPPFTMIIFWFISYAIVRHRLWDFRLVFVRSLIYTILIGVMASFYASAVFFVSQVLFHGQIENSQVVIYVVLALFVAFTFQPLKEELEEFSDRIFFKGKYNSNQLLSSLTKIMATTLSLEDLTKNTLHILLQATRVSRGAFVVATELGYYPPVSEGYVTSPSFDIETIKLLVAFKRIMVFEEEENENIKDAMRKLNITVAVPLYVGERPHGLLVLGEKKSGEIYSQQDLDLLKIFGPEVSVAVQNAKSYEEIKHFNVTLKEEVTKATSDLQAANTRLQELDKLKDEFLSIASHELRTPMTAVRSYLWMALDGKTGDLNEKQKLYLDRAYKSTNHLISLVNDLLNISRIESGRLTLDMQAVKLDILAQEVLDEVTPRAEELGVHLKLNNVTDLPDVLADPDKIKEVIFNLVGNSLKFTPKDGEISISFTQKGDMIEIQIKDTGSGILPEDLPKLFQKFGYIQSNYLPDRPAQGTGLGLYICKKIVELHKGTISVSSEGRGKGATFTFTLKVLDNGDLEMLSHKPKDEQQPSIGLEHQILS